MWILIIYPTDNFRLSGTCDSSNGQCIEFPKSNWVIFSPNSNMFVGSNSFEFKKMKNGWHLKGRSFDDHDYFKIRIYKDGYIDYCWKVP